MHLKRYVSRPVLAKIFCDEMKKHCTDKIVVEGVCKEVFEIILDLIYTDSVTVNNETSYPFAEFVDYLDITYNVRTTLVVKFHAIILLDL